ncbi:MAG: diguanylate cyclase [Deltaproteobacteria bacterium]|nr:diguanylate cyclase [Deltaproteobacteria bacterium]
MSGNLTTVRISLGLVILTCSILVGLDLAGVLPRQSSGLSEARIQLCESLALESAGAVDRKDFSAVRRLFDAVARRNEDVLSIGMRSAGGRLLVATRDHADLWAPTDDEGSTMTHARIPLTRRAERWGSIEVRFPEVATSGIFGWLWASTLPRVLLCVAISGFIAYTIYMKRLLRHLDPSSVIPPRVQATLDVMAEGVLLLDQNERIVLANATFAELIDRPAESLMGLKASDLGWLVPRSAAPARDLPWQRALEDSERHTGTPLCIRVGDDTLETFMVNGAPVADESGKARGAIATFDSVTQLEQKTEELEKAMVELEKSRDETRLRNEELQVLATCDPLTGIVNRRAFMERAELEFATAARDGRQLACVMIDIDHFKRVNDDHGHSTGDEVIRRLAQGLVAEWRDRDLVCRLGGEEFCMLLTDTDAEGGVALAMRTRRSIAADGFAPVPITASFGVSSRAFGASEFYELLNQADEALYASKENGRNRVTCYDQIQSSA